MKRHGFEITLGAIFLGIFLRVWYWLTPGKKLTPEEIDRNLEAVGDECLALEPHPAVERHRQVLDDDEDDSAARRPPTHRDYQLTPR